MAIDLTWAGGEHHFDLKIEHLRALQEKCDAGPAWVLSRLRTQRWMVDDVVATIRLGLEGGGLPKEDARAITKRHVEDEPLAMSVLTAQAILMSCLYEIHDDDEDSDEGESGAVVESPSHYREENSIGEKSSSGEESSTET